MTELPKNDFLEKDVEIRGRNFRIRELNAQQYDECVRMATKADDDVDMVALLRLMVAKAVVDPKLSADELSELPYGISRRLGSAVNRLHFSDSDDEEGNV